MGLFRGKDEKALLLIEGVYAAEVASQLKQYFNVDGYKIPHVALSHPPQLRHDSASHVHRKKFP